MSNHKKLLEVIEGLLRQTLILMDLAESSLDLAQNLGSTGIGELAGLIEQLIDDCDLGIAKLQDLSSLLDETREILGLSSGSSTVAVPITVRERNFSIEPPNQPPPSLVVDTGSAIFSSHDTIIPDITSEETAALELEQKNILGELNGIRRSTNQLIRPDYDSGSGFSQLGKSAFLWSIKIIDAITILTAMSTGGLAKQVPQVVDSLRDIQSFLEVLEESGSAVRGFSLTDASPEKSTCVQKTNVLEELFEKLNAQIGAVIEDDEKRKKKRREEELDKAEREQAERDRTPGAPS
ncbi:MAG: hypothetical protein MH825_12455 [Cyanobacteria bacterium]|nr:hypothetical protein [Cyanobacteriota bacterium]